MGWDYPPLDINPVFPGLRDIITIIIIIIIITIIIIIVMYWGSSWGKLWSFLAQDAILCQNVRMSNEKQ